MLARVKEFNAQHAGVEVEAIFAPSATYMDKINALSAAGTPPEVMQIDGTVMASVVDKQLVQRLDPFIKADRAFKLDAFLPGALADRHHLFGGVYYGLPNQSESPRVLFYNKRRVVEASAALPNTLEAQGKWTWDAYVDLATKLSKGSSPDRTYGGNADLGIGPEGYSWMASNGGRILADDLKSCVIDEKATADTIQFLADLIHKHRVAPAPGESLGAGDPFATGRQLMFNGGIWRGAPLNSIKDLEYGVAPLPKSPKGQRRSVVKPNALTLPVSVTGQKAATAWELIKFITGPSYQQGLIKDGLAMTNLKELGDFFLQNTPVKDAQVFLDAFEKREVAALPFVARWAEFATIANEELTKVRQGEVGVPAAAAQIKSRGNEVLRS
ncbi:MAG: extracellular solute-binding protein [Chloroflexota bacterium]|nr:extracellular solute-binding protein [Chloroflexota bacterium]